MTEADKKAFMAKVDTGEIIIKQGQNETWLDSRKLKVTLLGLLLIVVISVIGMYQGYVTKDNFSGILTAITGVIGGYVVGQGYADGQATRRN